MNAATRPLRILVVTAMYPHAERPGQGTFVEQQVQDLRRLGHDIQVLRIPGYKSPTHYLRAIVQVFLRTRRDRLDLVHAHFGLTGLASVLRWRTPLVITLHGSDALGTLFQRAATRVASLFATRIIAVSTEVGRRYSASIIPCGIDFERFVPASRDGARDRLGIRRDALLLLFPFDPRREEKRFGLATAVKARLQETHPQVDLLVVRDVPNEQMPLYYAAADVLLICSSREGSSTSIKEALACNLPVVSTRVGDAEEVLRGNPYAALAEADADSLATAVRRVLGESRPVDAECRDSIVQFSASRVALMVEDLYFEICGLKRV